MTEERKYAILFAATLLCARKLIETTESDSHAGAFFLSFLLPLTLLGAGMALNGNASPPE
ncbi:MAG TPA: hypothetical protein VNZ03_30450 [Terriglobales bacterium]|nr:hypothetical protein [Terriglobales bacterium]